MARTASSPRPSKSGKPTARGKAFRVESSLLPEGDYTNALKIAADGHGVTIEPFDSKLQSAAKNTIGDRGIGVNRRIVSTLTKSVAVAVTTFWVASPNTTWSAHNKKGTLIDSVTFVKDEKRIHTVLLSGKGIARLIGETTTNEGTLLNFCLSS